MYSFEQFKRSRWSLVILSEGRILFKSRARAIKPLVRFCSQVAARPTDLTIYDKYIGRAAALLMVSLKPTQIMTPIISEGGTACLAEHGLSFTAEQQVKYLMGVASEDMCRWEKQALGKSPEQFYSEVISQ